MATSQMRLHSFLAFCEQWKHEFNDSVPLEDGEGENLVQENETEEKWFSLEKHGWLLPAGFGLADRDQIHPTG